MILLRTWYPHWYVTTPHVVGVWYPSGLTNLYVGFPIRLYNGMYPAAFLPGMHPGWLYHMFTVHQCTIPSVITVSISDKNLKEMHCILFCVCMRTRVCAYTVVCMFIYVYVCVWEERAKERRLCFANLLRTTLIVFGDCYVYEASSNLVITKKSAITT